MKHIGIIGAMEEEICKLRELMSDVKEMELAGMTFCEGILSGKDVILVKSGIGKVNMAVCTQILIDHFHVEELINTGIAGSLCNEINIGDIVVSTDTMQHDVDVTSSGYKKGIIPRMETSAFGADQNLIDLAVLSCQKVNPDIQVFQGRIVSGDQFICDDTIKKQIIADFDALCTEMEGAAMAQTAWLNKIPFVVIRAISDKADHSAEMDYAEFEAQAISHTVKLVSQMLQDR